MGARRATAARFLPLAVLVVLATAAGIAYVAARAAVDDQNERLLEQRTDEVDVFLESAVQTLTASLRPLGVAARLDDEAWTGFRAEAASEAALVPGRTVLLARRDGERFVAVAGAGSGFAEGAPIEGEQLRAAQAAASRPGLASTAVYQRGGTRLVSVALGPPAAPADTVVVLESPLAPPGMSTVGQERPFEEIDAVVYATADERTEQVILSTTAELPLSGHVERREITVGDGTSWFLAAGAREPLGGAFADRVPLLILVMGVLSLLVATAVIAVLARRRIDALALVDARTAELQETVERLSELSRMKTTFLAAVSHELRTPLAAVVGFAELMRLRLHELSPQRQQQMLDRIVEQGGHLKELIDDLIDATRIEFGTLRVQREPVDVDVALRRTAQALGEHAERLRVRVDAPLPAALGNEIRLEQVLTNLVGNAVKHSHPGGPIEVTAEADATDVVLAVADTGPGIDPELLPDLFEPFIQGPDDAGREGGLGLGLYIVHGLVEAMGGSITVASSPEGTRFEVRLQRADAPEAHPAVAREPTASSEPVGRG